MKQFVAIILMCLLAANVGGFSIMHHFCGKKSQYISFCGKKKDSKCCYKGGIKDRGCCKTKFVKLQLDKSKSVSRQLVVQPQLIADVVSQPVFIPVKPVFIPVRPVFIAATSEVVPLIHPPPLLLSVRKHVLHGVFLI